MEEYENESYNNTGCEHLVVAYLVIGTLLFLAMGPALLILINDWIVGTAVSIMGTAIAITVWWTTGSLITAKSIVAEKGIESNCWFGLRREVYHWQDCIGFGLLQTPDFFYGIKWLYFSDRWLIDGYSTDGFIEWRDTSGMGGRPKVGCHLWQIQYTPDVVAALKEYMPPEMFDKITAKVDMAANNHRSNP